MGLKCPNCSNFVTELLSCDSCQAVGCIRCVTRADKQWLCYNCRKGKPEQKEDANNLFSMFG